MLPAFGPGNVRAACAESDFANAPGFSRFGQAIRGTSGSRADAGAAPCPQDCGLMSWVATMEPRGLLISPLLVTLATSAANAVSDLDLSDGGAGYGSPGGLPERVGPAASPPWDKAASARSTRLAQGGRLVTGEAPAPFVVMDETFVHAVTAASASTGTRASDGDARW